MILVPEKEGKKTQIIYFVFFFCGLGWERCCKIATKPLNDCIVEKGGPIFFLWYRKEKEKNGKKSARIHFFP